MSLFPKAEAGETLVSVPDDIFGQMEFHIPDGYRHVPVGEFAKRQRACFRRQERARTEKAEESAFDDLDGVYLWDSDTGDLMDISCMPCRWRIFVERFK